MFDTTLAATLAATSTFTGDRTVASVAALIALAGTVAGGLALARPAVRRSVVALGAGAVGLLVGGLVVVTADGGPGTGNGIVGGYVALALGLLAVVCGGAALARTRRVM